MSEDADWGPWVEHDGRGCPVVGLFVERVLSSGGERFADGPGSERVLVGVVRPKAGHISAWDWSNFLKMSANGTRCGKIIRYRVRRPKALRDLIALVETLPAPTSQPERVPEEVAP